MYRPTFNVDGKFRTALFSFWGCSLAILLTSSMCLDAAVRQKDRIAAAYVAVNCSQYDNHNEEHRQFVVTLNYFCMLCHNQYMQLDLHIECKSNCYQNDVFLACIKTVTTLDEVDRYEKMIVSFIGGDPKPLINDSSLLHDWDFGPQKFNDLGCRGSYDKYVFGEIDRMCYDCARLYESHDEMYIECRRECYTTIYYPACLESLKYDSESELIHYKALIEDFSGYKFIEWGSSNVSKSYPTTKD